MFSYLSGFWFQAINLRFPFFFFLEVILFDAQNDPSSFTGVDDSHWKVSFFTTSFNLCVNGTLFFQMLQLRLMVTRLVTQVMITVQGAVQEDWYDYEEIG